MSELLARGVMLFNASNACNARNTRKLYVIGTADDFAGVY